MILVSSRFVPVKSEEELKRYYDAGLLYFNHSMRLPREPLWNKESVWWVDVVEDYRWALAVVDTDRSEARTIPEDWGYLVEEDVVEGDSPNERSEAK